MALLGVNIDHVATIREARRTNEPDPVWAAAQAELGGADCITVHLREDRRHIQERDVRLLKETTTVRLNLELACESDVVEIACDVKPDLVTLVPEKREEVTTEGGLDIDRHRKQVSAVVTRLNDAGIAVSLFLDPDPRQIEIAGQLGVQAVELHTGQYALAHTPDEVMQELVKLISAAKHIRQQELILNAGHGLTYRNVQKVAQLDSMHELNIGHSIVSRSVFVGLAEATRQMKQLI
jgi:pyridoxine 5-phosphate synthase